MNEEIAAIGIDFGGTSVKAGVVAGDRVVSSAPAIATQDFQGADALIDAIADAVAMLRARHPDVAAVGVGMPGFVDIERGVVHNLTNVAGWQDIPLRKKLERRCSLPVAVDNDANCMAYAEWKRGAARGCRDVICITLGTGVGGGVIANGQMIRGAQFGAGEVGQMSIDYQGRTGHYGNRGALEDYVGNQEIATRAAAAYAAAGQSRSPEECTPAALAEAAAQGDPVALAIWEETGRMLASAVMSACWLLNPEAVVVGGGVARAGEVLFGPLKAHLLAQLSGPFRDHLKILPAAFGNDAGMIGAAAMALDAAGKD
jgi:glucokinase